MSGLGVATLRKNRKGNKNIRLETLDITEEGRLVPPRGYGWMTVFPFVAPNGRMDYGTTHKKAPTRDDGKSILAAR